MFHRPLLRAPQIWRFLLALLPRSNLSGRPAAASAEAPLNSQAHQLDAASWGYHHTALPPSGRGVQAQAGVPFNVTKEQSPHHTALATPRGPDHASLLAASQQLDFHLAQPLLLENRSSPDDAAQPERLALANRSSDHEATSWHYGEGFDELYELAENRLPKAANDAYFSYHGGDPDSPKQDIKMPDGTDVPWSFPNRVKSWKEHSESSLKHINDLLEKAKKTKQQLYESSQKFTGSDAHQSGKINNVIQTLGGGSSSSSSGVLGWLTGSRS